MFYGNYTTTTTTFDVSLSAPLYYVLCGHILLELCFKYITPCISMGSHAALCTTGSLSYHT